MKQYLNMKSLKHISLFLLISFIFNCCVNENINIKTDWEVYKLKGRVKKIEKNYYKPKMYFGEITKDELISPQEPLNFQDFFRELHFNEAGYITKNVYYDKNGSPDGFTIYKYDKYNRLINETDDKNNTIDITYNDNDFTSIVHSRFLNLDYPWEETTQNHYDENNNLIKKETFKEGKLIFRTFYEYNSNGKLISKKVYGGSLADEEGGLSSHWIYYYDDGGNNSKIYHETNFTKDNLLNRFNEYGDIIQITDDSGDLMPSIYSYEYKYDYTKNWTKRIEYYSVGNYKILSVLTIRKIEYYE